MGTGRGRKQHHFFHYAGFHYKQNLFFDKGITEIKLFQVHFLMPLIEVSLIPRGGGAGGTVCMHGSGCV